MTRSWVFSFLLVAAFSAAVAATQYQLIPAQSKLTFTAVQAGAPFDGAFKRFNANVQFDPAAATSCRFEVVIDMASVDTQDGERDDLIKGPDLFDVKRFPTARYTADRCSAQGKQFIGHGKLTLRNVARDVPITFTFDGSAVALKGSATFKRLDFGVGQGEWKDTEWVANDVKVNFALQLKK